MYFLNSAFVNINLNLRSSPKGLLISFQASAVFLLLRSSMNALSSIYVEGRSELNQLAPNS